MSERGCSRYDIYGLYAQGITCDDDRRGVTTACLGMLAWNIGRERARQIFAFEADRIEETVFEHIQTSDAVAKSMPAFFQVSVSVEADEFRVYSNEIVTRYPFLRSVIYYPPSLVF